MQLEEELRLRRVEIKDLQAKVRGMDGTTSNGEVAPNQPEGHALQEAGHRETAEETLALCRQEVESLKASLDSKNQEIGDLKQKVQQATKENMEMMDTWKVKKDTRSQRLQLQTLSFVADDLFQLKYHVCLAFPLQLVGAKHQTNRNTSITKHKSHFVANFPERH